MRLKTKQRTFCVRALSCVSAAKCKLCHLFPSKTDTPPHWEEWKMKRLPKRPNLSYSLYSGLKITDVNPGPALTFSVGGVSVTISLSHPFITSFLLCELHHSVIPALNPPPPPWGLLFPDLGFPARRGGQAPHFGKHWINTSPEIEAAGSPASFFKEAEIQFSSVTLTRNQR